MEEKACSRCGRKTSDCTDFAVMVWQYKNTGVLCPECAKHMQRRIVAMMKGDA